MEPLTIVSISLAMISFCISLYSLLYRVIKDRPGILILRAIPDLGGSRSANEPWRFSISSVSTSIKNNGKRAAMRVRGVISFGRLDALPLYPTEEGDVIFQRTIDLAPGEEINLVAAWRYSGNAIDGTQGLSVGEFLDKAPPMKVTIEYTEGKISKEYTREFLDSWIRKHQESHYLRR